MDFVPKRWIGPARFKQGIPEGKLGVIKVDGIKEKLLIAKRKQKVDHRTCDKWSFSPKTSKC